MFKYPEIEINIFSTTISRFLKQTNKKKRYKCQQLLFTLANRQKNNDKECVPC